MISAKALKALFCSLADDTMVDVWLSDANGGGVAVEDIVATAEMSVSPGFSVIMPTGYYMTTVNPVGVQNQAPSAK
jgi:hypothetical protein